MKHLVKQCVVSEPPL